MHYQIAIDGPAVSGKSSAARHLAGRLGWLYLDSGAVYRTITLASLRGISLQGEDLEERLDSIDLRLASLEGAQGCKIFLGDEEVSREIRTQKVTDHILPVSGSPRVRAWVVDFLRHLSHGENIVMDGRDIASVVFPEASFKFFITASVEARAKRRLADLGDSENYSLEALAEAIRKRDEGDRARKVGPLVKVQEAVLIDNSELGLMDTVDIMHRMVLDSMERENHE